jgi:hypothetical protein
MNAFTLAPTVLLARLAAASHGAMTPGLATQRFA